MPMPWLWIARMNINKNKSNEIIYHARLDGKQEIIHRDVTTIKVIKFSQRLLMVSNRHGLVVVRNVARLS